jgi:hypothetical protein
VTRPDPPSSDRRFGPLAAIAKVSRPDLVSRPDRPGAPGILPVYQKKDPHPAGDEIFIPAGDLIPTGSILTAVDSSPETHKGRLCLPGAASANRARQAQPALLRRPLTRTAILRREHEPYL